MLIFYAKHNSNDFHSICVEIRMLIFFLFLLYIIYNFYKVFKND